MLISSSKTKSTGILCTSGFKPGNVWMRENKSKLLYTYKVYTLQYILPHQPHLHTPLNFFHNCFLYSNNCSGCGPNPANCTALIVAFWLLPWAHLCHWLQRDWSTWKKILDHIFLIFRRITGTLLHHYFLCCFGCHKSHNYVCIFTSTFKEIFFLNKKSERFQDISSQQEVGMSRGLTCQLSILGTHSLPFGYLIVGLTPAHGVFIETNNRDNSLPIFLAGQASRSALERYSRNCRWQGKE